ncbi:MAG TPA: outer membrane protein assembly factor BamD [Stellaceae bacterium]|nr:outer membrane protein assembly factor BamD [Stellaceae bacterium]
MAWNSARDDRDKCLGARRVNRILPLLALIIGWGLAGCASTPKDTYVEKPVEELYNSAIDTMLDRNYVDALKQFEEVERQHPYSVWATKAQLMEAYVNYEANKYDEAVSAADRFIQLHPGNRDTAYAYYIKAISYYEQITDVERDQRNTERALTALQDVVNRYPDTQYARDARLKIDLTRDHLAGKEMEIGRYYQRRNDYLAAINRYKQVLSEYQTTTHVPEALARLTECYLALGVVDEAKASAAVLGYNFPNSDWYKDSYALIGGTYEAPDQPGWVGRIVNSIF